MADIPPIVDTRTITVHGWTMENIVRMVEYESMFQGAMLRVGPAEWRGTRTVQGYNGFPVIRTVAIIARDIDGSVPPQAIDSQRPGEFPDSHIDGQEPPWTGKPDSAAASTD